MNILTQAKKNNMKKDEQKNKYIVDLSQSASKPSRASELEGVTKTMLQYSPAKEALPGQRLSLHGG